MKHPTEQKALRINLDGATHGTFAEIGAGQEVARWFFAAGGASATVAKSISAYDMAVSDAIYGGGGRYVSRHRLSAMLDHEYALLIEQLDARRGADTAFFVFADTVATRGHNQERDGHGWMGMRFQHQPQAEPSQVVAHVRVLDTENVREQEALGIIGVNLIHGALYQHDDPTELIASLMDGLTPERIEIDMVRFSGPCFARVDNRLMSLQLVERDFTRAAMFTADGEVTQPAEALHNKPVLVLRGSFRPVTNVVMDMLEKSTAQFQKSLASSGEQPVVLMEMSLQDLVADERVDHDDFLARADVLGALGKTVLISRFSHDYRLVPYLRRYTPKPIGFAMGTPAVRELFEEKYYDKLSGGVLKAVGELFGGNVTVFVYPSREPDTGRIVTVDQVKVAPHLRNLYAHLLENKLLRPVEGAQAEYLEMLPRAVLAKIREGDTRWETMVPAAVAERVKERSLFRDPPRSAPRGPRERGSQRLKATKTHRSIEVPHDHSMTRSIEIKRAYDPPAKTDGARILVERLWPRGIKKEKLKLNDWLKEAAPSTALRKWFNHDPDKWKEFCRRYHAELDKHPEAWQPLLDAAKKGRVTLLFSSHDAEHNNVVALRAYLESKRKEC